MKFLRSCVCWLSLLLTAAPAVAQTQAANLIPEPGDRLAYVSATDSDQVWVFDLDTPGWVAQIDVDTEPRGIDVAPDNARVYVANRFGGTVGTISVIDTATFQVVATIDLDVVAVSTTVIRRVYSVPSASTFTSHVPATSGVNTGNSAVSSVRSLRAVAPDGFESSHVQDDTLPVVDSVIDSSWM